MKNSRQQEERIARAVLTAMDDPFSDLDYPRPQMRRDSFVSLDGIWDFSCDLAPVEEYLHGTMLGVQEYGEYGLMNAEICVPFCPESENSGLAIHPRDVDTLFYHRTFTLTEDFCRRIHDNARVLLHFGAVDYSAAVFVDGTYVGSHEGGYTHFTLDITDALSASCFHDIIVRVEDHLDSGIQPYGKQKHKRGGMWYTPVSGIWQSVWMECVPEQYIEELIVETNAFPDEKHAAAGADIRVKLSDGTEESFRIDIDNPAVWTPETPTLYPFELTVGEDRIVSYFALRELSQGIIDGTPRLLLNREPYFFHGVLDQGYFEKGIYTPDSWKDYQKDIEIIKKCGFNMLRKHIKIESDTFYYLCDVMGMAVFQDFVENGKYSFLRDTVLPSAKFGIAMDDRKLHKNPESRAAYYRSMEETYRQLRFFPCICYWTLFNEGWGQFDGASVYKRMKSLDGTRFIDTASGWFKRTESDVISDHVYFRKVKPPKRNEKTAEKPWVLSEYGGYVWKEEGHIWNPNNTYGYRTFASKEEYEDKLYECIERDVLENIGNGLCADVLTQVSDVEDEVNGLLTFDREILKINAARFAALGEKIKIMKRGNES